MGRRKKVKMYLTLSKKHLSLISLKIFLWHRYVPRTMAARNATRLRSADECRLRHGVAIPTEERQHPLVDEFAAQRSGWQWQCRSGGGSRQTARRRTRGFRSQSAQRWTARKVTIRIEMFYNFIFGFRTIGRSVWPQISRNPTPDVRAVWRFFSEFGAKRSTGSNPRNITTIEQDFCDEMITGIDWPPGGVRSRSGRRRSKSRCSRVCGSRNSTAPVSWRNVERLLPSGRRAAPLRGDPPNPRSPEWPTFRSIPTRMLLSWPK